MQKVRSDPDLAGIFANFSIASFRNIYTSLMPVIARSTDKELARQVSYLKAENQILRSRLPARVSLTQREKNRLVRFAKNLGSTMNELAPSIRTRGTDCSFGDAC
mgnify:CR=1 FL=1